jgi:hypothetical protein
MIENVIHSAAPYDACLLARPDLRFKESRLFQPAYGDLKVLRLFQAACF